MTSFVHTVRRILVGWASTPMLATTLLTRQERSIRRSLSDTVRVTTRQLMMKNLPPNSHHLCMTQTNCSKKVVQHHKKLPFGTGGKLSRGATAKIGAVATRGTGGYTIDQIKYCLCCAPTAPGHMSPVRNVAPTYIKLRKRIVNGNLGVTHVER
jgi:hypothetical protein